MRQAQLIDGLVRRFGEVDLLLAGRLGDDRVRGRLAEVVELEVRGGRRPRTVTGRRGHDLWRVAAARLPAEVYDRRDERLSLWNALSGSGPSGAKLRMPYDLVHVEHLGLAGVIPVRAAAADGLRSLGVQNIPSRMAEQAASLAPGRRQRWLLGAEAAAARRFEQRALGYADVVSVVSAGDAAELVGRPGRARPRGPGIPPADLPSAGVPFGEPGRAGGRARRAYPDRPEVLIAPNGVDGDRLRPTPLPKEPRLVFTGTLDYLPNVDGVTWFAHQVLPSVRRELPEARLVVAGRSPVGQVLALGGLEGVEVHADVPDISEHLAAARVAVVPVRIGTGSRLKLLEALAAGRAVVSTTIGAEGLAVESGRDLLVADEAAQLAAAVVLLCREEGLAGRLAEAGRRLVEERYSWAAIADRWAEDLARLLDSRR